MHDGPRFSIIPSLAVCDKNISATQLRVLCAIGMRTDRLGWCEPSYRRISEDTGLHRSTVIEAVKALVDTPYLEVAERRRADGSSASNAYRVVFDGPGEVVAKSDPVGAPARPGESELSDPSEDSLNVPTMNEDSEPNGSDLSDDPRKVIFTVGLSVLTQAGLDERKARSFLGSLARDHGLPNTAEACLAAKRERPIDPVPWLKAAAQRRADETAGKRRPGPAFLDEHAFTRSMDIADATKAEQRWFEERAGEDRCGYGPQPHGIKRPTVMDPKRGWRHESEW